MSTLTSLCPDDEQLWPAIIGTSVGEGLEHHLKHCPSCRDRVARQRELLSRLRRSATCSSDISPPAKECPSLSDLLVWASGNQRTGTAGAEESIGFEVDTPMLAECPILGKYRIVRKLSSGGQGTVFHAWHTTLHREVAIKVCRQSVDVVRQNRIALEGALLARINHPGLAQVYDLDVYEGHPYLVMEYVPGHNLRQVMQMSSLSMAARARIMRELSSAVAEAHRNGILHLDLKPENVMIDRQHRVKLIDFGMGWLMPNAESKDRLVAGTFGYMAPEQIQGQTARWSIRTDVFGLGAVLYFLLTGNPPVDTRRLRTAEEHEQAIQAAINCLMATPGTGGLQHACLRAMHPDPQQRFRDTHEFVRALRRARRVPWIAGVLIGAGLMGIVASLLPDRNMERQPALAVSEAVGQQQPVVRLGQRLTLEARCQVDLSLQLYIWLPRQGIVPFRGLTETIEVGQRIYRLPDQQADMALYDTEWVAVLAVVTPKDGRSVQAELQRLSQQVSGGMPARSPHVEFSCGSRGFQMSPQSSEGTLLQLMEHFRAAKLECQGVYARSAGWETGRELHLNSIRLKFP